MKLNVELKPPKLFGKKDKGECKDETNNTETCDKEKGLMDKFPLIGGIVVVSFAIGYFAGFNKGISKNANIYIIKS